VTEEWVKLRLRLRGFGKHKIRKVYYAQLPHQSVRLSVNADSLGTCLHSDGLSYCFQAAQPCLGQYPSETSPSPGVELADAAAGRSGIGAAIATVAKKRAASMRSAFIVNLGCLFVDLYLFPFFEEVCGWPSRVAWRSRCVCVS
jgi:hypothetical protein